MLWPVVFVPRGSRQPWAFRDLKHPLRRASGRYLGGLGAEVAMVFLPRSSGAPFEQQSIVLTEIKLTAEQEDQHGQKQQPTNLTEDHQGQKQQHFDGAHARALRDGAVYPPAQRPR